MDQLLYETKSRADELLKAAIDVWSANHNIDQIEGIESDPLFRLLLMAMAYQGEELRSEWESSRSNLLNDLVSRLSPYVEPESIPASMILHSDPHNGVPSVTLDSNCNFKLSGVGLNFIPLFSVRLISYELLRVTRLDGRRWKVSLRFDEPLSSLAGVSFQVLNNAFGDLNVSLNNSNMVLVKPWDRSGLPFVDCFKVDSMIYNQYQPLDSSSMWFDLFAEQNARLFMFKDGEGATHFSHSLDKIDLIFEFSSVDSEFVFNKEMILFNVFPVVNAEVLSVELSAKTPICKLSDSTDNTRNFITTIAPAKSQIFKDTAVTIRRFDVERFGIQELVNRLEEISHRFSTDYYAFISVSKLREGGEIKQLNALIKTLKDRVRTGVDQPSGVYALLKNIKSIDSGVSLSLRYLVSDNKIAQTVNIDSSSHFVVPSSLNAAMTYAQSPLVTGYTRLSNAIHEKIEAQYKIATGDRIVTLSDIKHFCYKELFVRFSILPESVRSVVVKHRLRMDSTYSGYEIAVFVKVENSSYLQKSFKSRIPFAELLLQKMIETRMVGIYPVVLSLEMEGE
ncbi:MAG: hypothetical protein SNG35_00930 [Rikenellaceae bacterium]